MSNQGIPSLDRLLEHRRWVRAVARGLLRDEHAAEDLAQEAWARVLRSPPDPDRDPKPWLRRVLKNLASNRFRGEDRRHRRETAWRDGRVQRTPAELVSEAEQHERVVRLVLDLEEPFKTTVLMHFYDGLGQKEIAERLGIPVGTVHSRLARAVERLKQRLDGEEQGDRRAWIAALVPLAGFEHVAPAAAAATTTPLLTGILLMTLTKPTTVLLSVLLLVFFAVGALRLTDDAPGADRQIPPVLDIASDRAASLEGRDTPLRSSRASANAADAAAETGQPRLVRGRVVDARGAPVAQADVFLLPRGASGASVEELSNPARGHLRTGVDGRFAIPLGDSGDVQLVAYAAGHLSAAEELTAAGVGPFELVLGDPWQLTVDVSDAEGHWPRNCALRVSSDFDTTFERAVDSAEQAFYFDTDPFDVPDHARIVIPVTTHARLRVQVRPPERMAAVPAVQYVEYPQAAASVRLIPSGLLRLGIVDGPTGAPLAEGLRASLVIREADTGVIAQSVSALVSDFELPSGFAPGRYVVNLEVTGYQTWKHVLELQHVGQRVALVARLLPATAWDSPGRVILRITDPHQASEALRTLLASGAPPGFPGEYRALVRPARSDAWIGAWLAELEDGGLELRPLILETGKSGLPPGSWDLFISRRDTGTAAFLKGVRIFGDQDNVVDVTLEPGTGFRLPQAAGAGVRFADLRVRTATTGDLPLILWTKDGSSFITAKSGMNWLLRLPRKPVVLGPFPASEIEVRLTREDGTSHSVRVRGAGLVDGSSAEK